MLLRALACGAAGFFTKDAAPNEFLDGVQAVCAGHYAVGSKLAAAALAAFAGGQAGADPSSDAGLSPAEQRILNLVGQAQSTRSIAEARGISEKTVRNHLANIYRKLDVKNRSEAILWSARMGLAGSAVE
jgi:DNA-binding NarL/FixJ family response regulator